MRRSIDMPACRRQAVLPGSGNELLCCQHCSTCSLNHVCQAAASMASPKVGGQRPGPAGAPGRSRLGGSLGQRRPGAGLAPEDGRASRAAACRRPPPPPLVTFCSVPPGRRHSDVLSVLWQANPGASVNLAGGEEGYDAISGEAAEPTVGNAASCCRRCPSARGPPHPTAAACPGCSSDLPGAGQHRQAGAQPGCGGVAPGGRAGSTRPCRRAGLLACLRVNARMRLTFPAGPAMEKQPTGPASTSLTAMTARGAGALFFFFACPTLRRALAWPWPATRSPARDPCTAAENCAGTTPLPLAAPPPPPARHETEKKHGAGAGNWGTQGAEQAE